MFVTVPGSQSSVVIGDLNPSNSYQVFVNAATSAEFGEYSSNLVVAQSKLTILISLQCTFSTIYISSYAFDVLFV